MAPTRWTMRRYYSAWVALALMLSSAFNSAVSYFPTHDIAPSSASYEASSRRILAATADIGNFSAAAMAPIVMSNCSRALTLTDNCRNKSDTDEFPDWLFCVGSTAARSCPQNPTMLRTTWHEGVVSDQVDATGLGLERAVFSDNMRITSLLINDNRLTELRVTKRMGVLNAAHNRFASFADLDFPFGAVILNVSHNTLDRVELTSAMAVLTTLDVTNGSVTKLDVSKATELLTVYAAFNQQTTIKNVSWPTRLRYLDVSHNRIAEWSNFTPPQGLRVLNASHNRATQFLAGNLSELTPKLEVVIFSDNNLTSVSGVAWTETLRELDVRGNPLEYMEIFDIDIPIFQRLESFLVPDEFKSSDSCAKRNATTAHVAGGITVCVVPAANVLKNDASGSGAPVSKETVKSQESSSSSLGMILAIVIAVSLVVMIAFGIVFNRRRQHRAASSGGDSSINKRKNLESSSESAAITTALSSLRSDDALAVTHIRPTDVQLIRVLGDSGDEGTALVRVGENAVVRKQVGERDAASVLSLVDEIRVTGPLEHAKIVSFCGFTCTSVHDLSIYHEYMANGSLAAWLQRQSSSSSWFYASSDQDPVVRLDVAINIAEAMVYLHSFDPPVVHGNIRAKNVLFDDKWSAKLSGAGQRNDLTELDRVDSNAVACLAPELLRAATSNKQNTSDEATEELSSAASDVYAFGVFLAELDGCKTLPFDHSFENRTNTDTANEILNRGPKPQFHNDCPSPVQSLAMACLAPTPEDRPTAMKVYYELTQVRKQARSTQSRVPSPHVAV